MVRTNFAIDATEIHRKRAKLEKLLCASFLVDIMSSRSAAFLGSPDYDPDQLDVVVTLLFPLFFNTCQRLSFRCPSEGFGNAIQ